MTAFAQMQSRVWAQSAHEKIFHDMHFRVLAQKLNSSCNDSKIAARTLDRVRRHAIFKNQAGFTPRAFFLRGPQILELGKGFFGKEELFFRHCAILINIHKETAMLLSGVQR